MLQEWTPSLQSRCWHVSIIQIILTHKFCVQHICLCLCIYTLSFKKILLRSTAQDPITILISITFDILHVMIIFQMRRSITLSHMLRLADPSIQSVVMSMKLQYTVKLKSMIPLMFIMKLSLRHFRTVCFSNVTFKHPSTDSLKIVTT